LSFELGAGIKKLRHAHRIIGAGPVIQPQTLAHQIFLGRVLEPLASVEHRDRRLRLKRCARPLNTGTRDFLLGSLGQDGLIRSADLAHEGGKLEIDLTGGPRRSRAERGGRLSQHGWCGGYEQGSEDGCPSERGG
jgi:hypothetical protein